MFSYNIIYCKVNCSKNYLNVQFSFYEFFDTIELYMIQPLVFDFNLSIYKQQFI